MKQILLLVVLLQVACEKSGDDGYTALTRYNVVDFRVAGIHAELVSPVTTGQGPIPDAQIRFRALILKSKPDPVKLSWVDCTSLSFAESEIAMNNADCLGTVSEIGLGGGSELIYTPTTPVFSLPVYDATFPFNDAGGLVFPDAAGWYQTDAGVTEMVEMDDGIVYLRATQGDVVRYGRKNFLGLFAPDSVQPHIENLLLNGETRHLTDDSTVRVKPSSKMAIRFTAVGVAENVAVQWFVTEGTLSKQGLTYYVEVDSRDVDGEVVPLSTAENTWTVPEEPGKHQLLAVIGGSRGWLPHVRLKVEVQP